MTSIDALCNASRMCFLRRRPTTVLWGSAFLAAFLAASGDSAAADGLGASAEVDDDRRPFVIKLRREAIPVRHQGKVVSYKTSYSGPLHVGFPQPQEFRVVFDTGSGHVILPSSECRSDACLKHNRYNFRGSDTAVAVNLDGSAVLPGNQSDQVTIGFGTGKVVGEFVRDRVCLGSASHEHGATMSSAACESGACIGRDYAEASGAPCVDMHAVMAVEMSKRPFMSFGFDGIMGLGLRPLALSSSFSLLELLFSASGKLPAKVARPIFAVYLGGEGTGPAENAKGEGPETDRPGPEIAFGGHDPRRLAAAGSEAGASGTLTWIPAARPELGYWQVKIRALRIGGQLMSDWCGPSADGECFGIMDTGTSHLGIPGPQEAHVAEMLTRPAEEGLEDCRRVEAPVLEIELQGFNITLRAQDYMRQLPLANDVPLRSAGVSPKSHEEADGDNSAPSRTSVAPPQDGRMLCKPKLMPVNMPQPLGPKLFILGEPVLQRYYTAFDWGQDPPRIGLGLASNANHAKESIAASPVAEIMDESMRPAVLDEPSTKGPGPAEEPRFRYDDPIFLAQLSAEGAPARAAE